MKRHPYQQDLTCINIISRAKVLVLFSKTLSLILKLDIKRYSSMNSNDRLFQSLIRIITV